MATRDEHERAAPPPQDAVSRLIYVSRTATEKATSLCEALNELRPSALARVLQEAAHAGERPERPFDKLDFADGRLLPAAYLTTNGDQLVVVVVDDQAIPGAKAISTVRPMRSCYVKPGRDGALPEDSEGAYDLRRYLDVTGKTADVLAGELGNVDGHVLAEVLRGRTPSLRLALALEERLEIDPRSWLERRAAA